MRHAQYACVIHYLTRWKPECTLLYVTGSTQQQPTLVFSVDAIIGQHLFEQRDLHNMSQRQLAEYLTLVTNNKWNQQLVSRAESGDRQFRVVDLFAIAGIFEISILALMFPPNLDVVLRSGNLEFVGHVLLSAFITHPRGFRGDSTGYPNKMPPPDPNFERNLEGFLDVINWTIEDEPNRLDPRPPKEEA